MRGFLCILLTIHQNLSTSYYKCSIFNKIHLQYKDDQTEIVDSETVTDEPINGVVDFRHLYRRFMNNMKLHA